MMRSHHLTFSSCSRLIWNDISWVSVEMGAFRLEAKLLLLINKTGSLSIKQAMSVSDLSNRGSYTLLNGLSSLRLITFIADAVDKRVRRMGFAERPRKGGPQNLAGRQAVRCRYPDFEIKSLARDQRSTLPPADRAQSAVAATMICSRMASAGKAGPIRRAKSNGSGESLRLADRGRQRRGAPRSCCLIKQIRSLVDVKRFADPAKKLR
jgi:hypothetical protein